MFGNASQDPPNRASLSVMILVLYRISRDNTSIMIQSNIRSFQS